VVHVLAIDSTSYAEALASGTLSAALEGICSGCGGHALELTGASVERGLQTEAGWGRMRVHLARCLECGSRERVLPCDVLPGKVNSVTNVLGAVADVTPHSLLNFSGASFPE
jgi:hypothetical protein